MILNTSGESSGKVPRNVFVIACIVGGTRMVSRYLRRRSTLTHTAGAWNVHRIRDFLICLSFANLCFLDVPAQLLDRYWINQWYRFTPSVSPLERVGALMVALVI